MGPLSQFAKAAGAATVAAAYLFQSGWVRFQYPDGQRFPVRGIDVSHHQGTIDWTRAGRAGLAFAYIKATEGGDHRDRRFEANWRGAQEAGLAPGAYHFFTFCRPGVTQALNFIEAIGKVRGPMLPPAIDLEFEGNCERRPSREELARELRSFQDRVRSAVGVEPVLYVTPSFWKEYRSALPAGSELWVRSVFAKPESSFGGGWTFWQFAERGRVPGVRGPVDLNVFRGSEADWRAFLRRRLRLHPAGAAGASI